MSHVDRRSSSSGEAEKPLSRVLATILPSGRSTLPIAFSSRIRYKKIGSLSFAVGQYLNYRVPNWYFRYVLQVLNYFTKKISSAKFYQAINGRKKLLMRRYRFCRCRIGWMILSANHLFLNVQVRIINNLMGEISGLTVT